MHDTRNVIVAPTEGNLGKASCEVSSNLLGATIAFVRLEGTEHAEAENSANVRNGGSAAPA